MRNGLLLFQGIVERNSTLLPHPSMAFAVQPVKCNAERADRARHIVRARLDPPGRLGQGRRRLKSNGLRMSKPRLTQKDETSGGFLANVAHRPRLFAGAVLMVLAYFLVPSGVREATRLVIAWNVGAWAFLILIAVMAADPRRDARVQARPEDENQWVLVALGIAASCAALAAIVWELGPVKEMAGLSKAVHLALVGATVLSAWTFLQVMFALHYAGVYFAPQAAGIHGGLEFPGGAQPGWIEFFYQAFVVGCTFASSDVNITSKRMRRICVIQGVVGFFFNAIILALTINIAANLF
jgi:uncharacterized membrane protein